MNSIKNWKLQILNTSKLLQFQYGLKGLKKRNLSTTNKKKEKEKAKIVKHLTHINLKGITKGTPESDIHTSCYFFEEQ